MADITAGAARCASVAEVRADVERAGGDASVLCGFGRCFCVKTALGIRRKERGHWPQFQEPERSNRVLLATAIAAFDSLESGAKDGPLLTPWSSGHVAPISWVAPAPVCTVAPNHANGTTRRFATAA